MAGFYFNSLSQGLECCVEVPNPDHPYGVRGVGETSIIPPMGAIANAVADATGLRMPSLPMSPPKVLKALDDQPVQEAAE